MGTSSIVCPLCGHEKNVAPVSVEVQAHISRGVDGSARVIIDVIPIKQETPNAE